MGTKGTESYRIGDQNALYYIGGAVQHGDGAEGPTQGKMYFGKQFGFLYGLNQEETIEKAGRTLGHEICHGNYKLHHVFTNIFLGEASKYSDDNLMSYSSLPSATGLNKIQWDIIHDPGVIWGFAARDEDQQARQDKKLNELVEFLKTCISSSGEDCSNDKCDFNYKDYVDATTKAYYGNIMINNDPLNPCYVRSTYLEEEQEVMISKEYSLGESEEFVTYDPVNSFPYFVTINYCKPNNEGDGISFFFRSKEIRKDFLEEVGFSIIDILCSDTIIYKNEFVKISDVLEMPDIKVKNKSGDNIVFRLKIEYKRDIRNDEDYFPNDGEWVNINNGETWDVNFGDKIRGGKATLEYKINKENNEFVFYIHGENPNEQDIKNYLDEKGYSNIWFLTRMIRQESSYQQFDLGTNYSTDWDSDDGCPKFGSPHGWGLMQLDVIGGTEANPLRPSAQQLWNWEANIDGGVYFLLNEKHNAVENHFEDDMIDVADWNDRNPDNKIEGAYPQTEGAITYTHSDSRDFNIDFGGEPSGSNKSFIDATWIKHYNGSSGGTDGYPGYYYILKQLGDNKPFWDIQRTNSNGHNYVGAVSNQNP